ncbi:MAG: capsular polysaccharide biosynthesis protein [Rhodobacterales bacterium]|nr:capsular polysaccharide biosynthesis protein [Rhodobacterales bacterium]
MGAPAAQDGPAGQAPRRALAYSAGFFRGALPGILAGAGLRPRIGLAGAGDAVLVWGRSPYAPRGEAMAARAGAALIRVEDAFLRGIHPGRGAPLGLMIDRTGGVHFDASVPSALETILARDPLDDHVLLTRAREAMARLAAIDASKYNAHDPALPPPPPGYVLVVDQVRGDASVRHGGVTAATFAEMLDCALQDHPGARVVIKAHPETRAGRRPGHFGPEVARDRVSLLTDPVSPRALLEGAIAVYTATSQLGFEAILAGHRPQVFGAPFYAGWGLTADRASFPRRRRRLTPTQLFAGAMILAPHWHDPCRNRPCSLEQAIDQLEAEIRAHREDRAGHVAIGMRLWKRGAVQGFFGGERRVLFRDDPAAAARVAQATGRRMMAWEGRAPADSAGAVARVEDGFLRSRGLGADLVPPLSLVVDDLGIYYDPGTESRLERLVAAPLPPGGRARAERLVAALRARGVTKYNLGGAVPDLPAGHRVLVPGQVEDDASIRLGGGAVRTNLALLQAVRAARPGAVILFKPHPDVEAGLRPGAVEAAGLADRVLTRADPVALLAQVDEVWTMTSLMGFEALIRGVPVTCLGAPFYAGWGLTTDLGPVPARRQARPDVLQLAHAALIAYPRYRDPVSGRPCPVEVAVDRLATGGPPRRGLALRLLAKAQGAAAGLAWIWRR